MGKTCKSCGHYYSGEYCDKCGYGKPAKVAESVKKYRKAARKKPLRMQTEEDKKLFMDVFKKLADSIRISATERYKKKISSNLKGFVSGFIDSPKEA